MGDDYEPITAEHNFSNPYGESANKFFAQELEAKCTHCGIKKTSGGFEYVVYQDGWPEPNVYCSASCLVAAQIENGIVGFEDVNGLGSAEVNGEKHNQREKGGNAE